MAEGRASKKASRRTQVATETRNEEEWSQLTQASPSNSPTHVPSEDDGAEHTTLSCILREIKEEQRRTNDRLDEAEGRIEEAETTLQAMGRLMKKLMHRQATTEAKLIDQEGRARRDNLRIYGIPEKDEGENMCGFLEKLLRETLDISEDMEVRIERAHRVQAAKPVDAWSKPRSIVAKFASHRVKEEVIRRAWQKKSVYYNNTRFFIDHDYPPAVLKHRFEYFEVKKILKERKIKFQTPYPAKLRVYYNDGIQLYQSAAQATEDMASRGLPVTVITAPLDQDDRELQLISAWQVAGDPKVTAGTAAETQREGRTRQRSIIEKLQEFKRNTHSTK